jgi:predicted helicase
MQHYVAGPNLGLLGSKGVKDPEYRHVFVTSTISEAIFLSGTTASNAMNFPLYLYPDEQDLDQSIRVNFDPKLYAKIRKAAGLGGKPKTPDTEMIASGRFRELSGDDRPDEVKVFDYIYGVLHCPAYRQTFAEFLKIDFPRVPFPPSPEVFRTISEQGEALRRLHLMEDAAIGDTPYPFRGEAAAGEDCVVDKPRFQPQSDRTGRVYINGKGDTGQYFDNVPAVSWGFPIGGYQPAQKWLQDRKGRALSFDDIRHYQKIIKILAETDRIIKGIEMPVGERGQ